MSDLRDLVRASCDSLEKDYPEDFFRFGKHKNYFDQDGALVAPEDPRPLLDYL